MNRYEFIFVILLHQSAQLYMKAEIYTNARSLNSPYVKNIPYIILVFFRFRTKNK